MIRIGNPHYLASTSGRCRRAGCVEAGLKFKLLVATDQVDCEVKGFGKACVGGGITLRNNDVSEAKMELDPIVVGISAKVKSKGYIKFTLVDWKYNYALTKPYEIWKSQ